MKLDFGKAISNVKFTANKYAPEIGLALGIVSVVAGVVCACKGTIKAQEVVKTYKEERDVIEKAHDIAQTDSSVDYTEEQYKQDRMRSTVKCGFDLAKCYAPTALFTALGILMFVKGYGCLSTRYFEAVALCGEANKQLNGYRDAVKGELGEEKEQSIFAKAINDICEKKDEQAVVEAEDPEKPKVVRPDNPQSIIFSFDEACALWEKDYATNKYTLIEAEHDIQREYERYGRVTIADVAKKLRYVGEMPTAWYHLGWTDKYHKDDICPVTFNLMDADMNNVNHDRVIRFRLDTDGDLYANSRY